MSKLAYAGQQRKLYVHITFFQYAVEALKLLSDQFFGVVIVDAVKNWFVIFIYKHHDFWIILLVGPCDDSIKARCYILLRVIGSVNLFVPGKIHFYFILYLPSIFIALTR